MPHPNQKLIMNTLWRRTMPDIMKVWTILDGARDERIHKAVEKCYEDKCCLFAGKLPEPLVATAPYLVQLDNDAQFTRYLIDNGWGQSWGIFFWSGSSMETLRRHFRGFLRVQDEKGTKMLFRYYDPRVLRLYLPTCAPEELQTIFGPVNRFLMESEDGAATLEFRLEGGKLAPASLTLEPAGAAR